MKKTFVAVWVCFVWFALSNRAEAEVTFLQRCYTCYQGETAAISFFHDGKTPNERFYLLNERGEQLAEAVTFGIESCQTVYLNVTEEMQSMKLFVQREKTEAPDDAMLLAIDRRPGATISRVEREDNKIALTFDTSNGIGYLPQILDILNEYNVKATFFLQGTFLRNYPDKTQMIEANGHEVGNHSYNHPNMLELDAGEILSDFEKSADIFEKVLGHQPVLYRPPSGASTLRDRAIARTLGQEVIHWTVDSRDGFHSATLKEVLNRVRENMGPGSIILMHVYGKYTVQALRTLLPEYLEQGYSFVTVSELLLQGDTYVDSQGVQRLRETDEAIN